MIYAVVGWLVRLKTRSVVVAHVRYYNVLLWDGVRFVTSQTPGAMVFPNNELLSACSVHALWYWCSMCSNSKH